MGENLDRASSSQAFTEKDQSMVLDIIIDLFHTGQGQQKIIRVFFISAEKQLAAIFDIEGHEVRASGQAHEMLDEGDLAGARNKFTKRKSEGLRTSCRLFIGVQNELIAVVVAFAMKWQGPDESPVGAVE